LFSILGLVRSHRHCDVSGSIRSA